MNAESEELKAARQKRKALLAAATLMEENGGLANVRVRNLSATGLGGVATDPMRVGVAYTVLLKGIGEVRGEIVWSSGTRFGMRFDKQIELEALEMADLADLIPKQDENFYRRYKLAPENYRRPALRTRK